MTPYDFLGPDIQAKHLPHMLGAEVVTNLEVYFACNRYGKKNKIIKLNRLLTQKLGKFFTKFIVLYRALYITVLNNTKEISKLLRN